LNGVTFCLRNLDRKCTGPVDKLRELTLDLTIHLRTLILESAYVFFNKENPSMIRGTLPPGLCNDEQP
jgi:hypothetical protein